ncbi:hypothetical protein DICVIV_09036 [Dictyocaulus viviparus]|uniref:Uncharacterized protein n=1 Tax=Dictyocaulus viviparus TaxID=29172 RepID=A0A0D8XK10_DICVI|nr:hypothetical protein DICVIV_09036 [Dictyocaulus viviparus]
MAYRWLQSTRHIFPSAREYLQAYHRLLFMERVRLPLLLPEVYCGLEQGPTESEFMACFKIISECHLRESILGDHITMLDSQEAIRLIEGLTKRAVENRVSSDDNLPLISFSNPVQLIDREEFCFAMKKYYWKVWYIVMMWSCAGKVGEEMEKIYNRYPQLRLFIHMVLVKSFRFPLEFEGKTPEEWEAMEAEMVKKEKEAILSMESFLMKQNIDEENSRFIGTLCFNHPRAIPRRPPEPFIRKLEALALDCSMASRLCECRQPDMVDQLIRNVGPSKAMPAIQKTAHYLLKELFATNASAIEAMPVSTLCQFLQYDLQHRKSSNDVESNAVHTIVARVRAAFADDAVQDDCVSAVLFLLDRRTAFNVRERLGAKLVLTNLFVNTDELMVLNQGTEGVWMEGLRHAPFYRKIAPHLAIQLAKAAVDSEGLQLDCILTTIRQEINKNNMHQASL